MIRDGTLWKRHPTQKGVWCAVGPAPQRVKRYRRPERSKLKPDYWRLAQRIMMAVSNCVPDCDPWEQLAPWVRQNYEGDVTKLLDKAVRAHLGDKSYNAYLIAAWDGWNEVCEPDQRMPNPWRPA